MKKMLILMFVLVIAATAGFAGGQNEAEAEPAAEMAAAPAEPMAPEATDKLVVYSPNSDGLLGATIPAFEAKYGVEVEVISAGTGEVFKRLEGEANNPYADVAFGGAYATYMNSEELFQAYTSVNDGKVIDLYRNTSGFITPYVLDGSIILVNKNLIGNIEINGYKDWRTPEASEMEMVWKNLVKPGLIKFDFNQDYWATGAYNLLQGNSYMMDASRFYDIYDLKSKWLPIRFVREF